MYALGRKWQVVQHQAHVQRLILQAISRLSMRSMASLEELPLYRGVRYGSNRIQALSPTMASHKCRSPLQEFLVACPTTCKAQNPSASLVFPDNRWLDIGDQRLFSLGRCGIPFILLSHKDAAPPNSNFSSRRDFQSFKPCFSLPLSSAVS
jgi:hypothetical protein